MIYDVVIVGAGPAGSTLARLLGENRKNLKVLLIEKREFDKELKTDKCCGGLLAPDAQKMLAKYGLGLPKKILTGPQLFSVKAIDFNTGLERNYQRHYINMDRIKFDSWLIDLVPDNVEMLFGASLKGIEKNADGCILKINHLGKIFKIETKIIAGADGATSKVRNLTMKKPFEGKEYIAVQEWFKIKKAIHPCYYSIFDKDVTDFYSWIIQKEDNLILGSALKPSSDVGKRYELLKERIRNYGFDLDDSIKKSGAKLLRPGFFNGIICGKERVAFLGEAAGLISPSSAEGLSYAMESAMILSEVLNEKSDFLKRYSKGLRKIRLNLALKNIKSKVMYNNSLRKFIMRSGIFAFK